MEFAERESDSVEVEFANSAPRTKASTLLALQLPTLGILELNVLCNSRPSGRRRAPGSRWQIGFPGHCSSTGTRSQGVCQGLAALPRPPDPLQLTAPHRQEGRGPAGMADPYSVAV